MKVNFPMNSCKIRLIKSDPDHVLITFGSCTTYKMKVISRDENDNFELKHTSILRPQCLYKVKAKKNPNCEWREYSIVPEAA